MAAQFSVPFQTSIEDLLQNECWCLLPELKQPDRGAGYPLPSSTQVKERIEVDFYTSCMLWPLRGRTVIEKPVTNIIQIKSFCSLVTSAERIQ